MADQPERVSTRATGVVGIAVMSSRILGLIREQIFAGLFGATRNLDIFLIAFRVPNLLRDLFAEGALSTAFVTTFSKKIAVDGDASAWRLGNKIHECGHAGGDCFFPSADRCDSSRFYGRRTGHGRTPHPDHVAVHLARLA